MQSQECDRLLDMIASVVPDRSMGEVYYSQDDEQKLIEVALSEIAVSLNECSFIEFRGSWGPNNSNLFGFGQRG